MKELAHLLGLDNVSGPFYAFWSGVGLTVLWPIVYLKHHNCHAEKCWRLGHNVNGTIVCKRHKGDTK